MVGVVFGYFTTFCNYLATFLPSTDNIVVRVALMLVSTIFIAGGIFFYLPANLIPLAGEGVMQAVSEVTHIEFSKVRHLAENEINFLESTHTLRRKYSGREWSNCNRTCSCP